MLHIDTEETRLLRISQLQFVSVSKSLIKIWTMHSKSTGDVGYDSKLIQNVKIDDTVNATPLIVKLSYDIFAVATNRQIKIISLGRVPTILFTLASPCDIIQLATLDDTHLASLDRSGRIIVWNITNQLAVGEKSFNFEGSPFIRAMWVLNPNQLLCNVEDSLQVFNLATGYVSHVADSTNLTNVLININ